MGKFNKTRKEFLEWLLEETEFPTNKFVYETEISSPYGALLILPVYLDDDLEKAKEGLLQRAKGIRIRLSVVTNVLVGDLGTRKFDMQQSSSHISYYKN
jgi:hypothetical protein